MNGRLTGVIEPLGLVFSANVLPKTGGSANSARFYKSNHLGAVGGARYSVVGTNNEILVLAQTANLSTGGLTVLAADGTFTVESATGGGVVTISEAVDATPSAVAGAIRIPGQAATSFAGVAITTTRTDRLTNLSSRLRVGAGERVLITGS